MIVPRLIERKRNGESLEPSEIRELVLAYTAGDVPDYQIASLLMAIYFRGLGRPEMNAMMDAMLESGKQLDLSRLGVPRIDKHSTGGVGDKVSLILAPLIASVGVAVPMMSGRALGHTGGTLDKLESIPGFRTALSLAEAETQIASIGCAMLSQTEEIVPADRKLYALRDATATVEVIPLIAASIMSKKIAESLTGLVLDIKRGSGAFLPDLTDEIALAEAMIDLGAQHACPVVALVTAMDRPLGFACGNALEVSEAIDVLNGGGPQDLIEVTLALGAEMLLLSRLASNREGALAMLDAAISSGKALEKFEQLVAAQGGDRAVVRNTALLPKAPHRSEFVAERGGFVQSVDPRAVGYGVIALGGGRRNMEEKIDPSVGFVITAKPGDRVTKGETLATIHARSRKDLKAGNDVLHAAVVISGSTPEWLPLVSYRITAGGVEDLLRPAKRGRKRA
ncbi:MAG TPA: thymidine phosphorylase [Gemmatimonadaceae bacterium]|nr:thymidine phosphorylase [Gemmatimonadaceae bacterium]